MGDLQECLNQAIKEREMLRGHLAVLQTKINRIREAIAAPRRAALAAAKATPNSFLADKHRVAVARWKIAYDLRGKGYSLRQIGAEFGVAMTTVRKMVESYSRELRRNERRSINLDV